MNDEQERHQPEQERVRLPGYHEPPAEPGPAHRWQGEEYWPSRDHAGNAGGHGIRASRRASNWTAAALIAGVAATTGYLAHEIPASGSGGTGGTGGTGTSGAAAKPAAKPGTVSPSTPAVSKPVVTSGGSGAAGGGGDD
jgi:hypothetical protein